MTAVPAIAPPPLRPRHRFDVLTPLGVRFSDQAALKPVVDGLIVVAWALSARHRPTVAVRSPSGVFALHGLPRLHDIEYPQTRAPRFDSLPDTTPRRPFLIAVRDRRERFLPSVFIVALPLALPPASLPETYRAPILDAPLFSAPNRTASLRLSAIRAELRDADTLAPASHAAVRVTIAGLETLGIADGDGRIAVFAATPVNERLDFGSPPGTPVGTPSRQTWPVSVRVAHSPNLPIPSLPDAELPPPWQGLPTTRTIIESQPPVMVLPIAGGAAAEAWSGEIGFGEDLVLRSESPPDDPRHAYLLISRG